MSRDLKEARVTSSWWCGLSREEFYRQVQQRDEAFRRQQSSYTDWVGESLRQAWEPKQPKQSLRGPI